MIITSWDDYCIENNKLIELLLRYDIPATFYIEIIPHRNGSEHDAMMQIHELINLGFDIGSHSMTHPKDMKMLSDAQITWEVEESKKILNTIRPVDKFCYPRGRYDLRVIDALKKAGYTYGRTTEIKDDIVNVDPFRSPTSCHVFQRKEYNGKHWLEYAKKMYKKTDAFHLWGHAWEIERDNQWQSLENFFKYIKAESSEKNIFPK